MKRPEPRLRCAHVSEKLGQSVLTWCQNGTNSASPQAELANFRSRTNRPAPSNQEGEACSPKLYLNLVARLGLQTAVGPVRPRRKLHIQLPRPIAPRSFLVPKVNIKVPLPPQRPLFITFRQHPRSVTIYS